MSGERGEVDEEGDVVHECDEEDDDEPICNIALRRWVGDEEVIKAEKAERAARGLKEDEDEDEAEASRDYVRQCLDPTNILLRTIHYARTVGEVDAAVGKIAAFHGNINNTGIVELFEREPGNAVRPIDVASARMEPRLIRAVAERADFNPMAGAVKDGYWERCAHAPAVAMMESTQRLEMLLQTALVFNMDQVIRNLNMSPSAVPFVRYYSGGAVDMRLLEVCFVYGLEVVNRDVAMAASRSVDRDLDAEHRELYAEVARELRRYTNWCALRGRWMQAVVACATHMAVPEKGACRSPLLRRMLQDCTRITISSTDEYHVCSEYAGMVASFLGPE